VPLLLNTMASPLYQSRRLVSKALASMKVPKLLIVAGPV
jgi:hypothetical protein